MTFFRADGNTSIGSGHVMRCLSIAREASLEEKVLFITADECFSAAISDAGIENYILHTSYTDLSQELEKMEKLIEMFHPSMLFIDSYYVTYSYLNTLWKLCASVECKLIYIDDVLGFAYPCDVLLNYNIYGLDKKAEYEKMYKEDGRAFPLFLLGASFAPLRTEFQSVPARVVRKNATDILVSTGGSDPEHLTVQLVKEVLKRNLPYTFHFIVGSMNEDADEIKILVTGLQKMILHRNVTAMAELMRSVDLAVSAAGSTLYELCSTQTPTLTYILADNQVIGAEAFQNKHVFTCVGDYRLEPKLASKLIDSAVDLARDYGTRKDIAQKMREVVDGRGTRRILDQISKLQRCICKN